MIPRNGFLILSLCGNLAWSEEAKPLPKFVPTTHRAPDLDFSEDSGIDDMAISEIQENRMKRTWVYWGLGATAAAGGMTFYFLDLDKPTAPKKRVEVFTDKPD